MAGREGHVIRGHESRSRNQVLVVQDALAGGRVFSSEFDLSVEAHPELPDGLRNRSLPVSGGDHVHSLLPPEDGLEAVLSSMGPLQRDLESGKSARAGVLVDGGGPSEISALVLKSLGPSETHFLDIVKEVIGNPNLHGLVLLVVSVIVRRSLLTRSLQHQAASEGRGAGQHLEDSSELGVLSVGGDGQVGLSGHLVVPEGGPVHLHEFVVTSNNNVLRHL
mmetsp:Transcript_11028/g.16742  ORF Transcript_11028/g.16742 Transcript_11028/m.16742 type:complete len:221 (-) Transcript_11028:907-1569(-)